MSHVRSHLAPLDPPSSGPSGHLPPQGGKELDAALMTVSPTMPYSFRDARVDDMPLLRGWLRTPEVARWWGDPSEQAAMLEEELSEPGMVMRIVSLDAKPFAYAQDYAVDRWPQPHFAGLPAGSRAIDSFIGEPEMIGCGHGSAYLRRLAARLVGRRRAGRGDRSCGRQHARPSSLRESGFAGDRVVETREGPAMLMIFEPRASGV